MTENAQEGSTLSPPPGRPHRFASSGFELTQLGEEGQRHLDIEEQEFSSDIKNSRTENSTPPATPNGDHGLALPVHHAATGTAPSLGTGLLATLRHRALNIGPGWFAANMGLGIASSLLYNMPYSFKGLQEIGIAYFIANVILFFFLLSLTIARYALWPRLLPIMLYHPTQAFFLGTFTMGAVTLVEVIIMALVPWLGQAWLYVGWVSWWIIAAMTIVVAIGVPWITQTRQEQSFEKITGVWFLPIVAPVVCASAGSIVANAMVDAGVLAASLSDTSAANAWYSHARVQEITCYLMLGIGLVPSILWMPVYSTRLAIHKLPTAVIVSCFVPLGCCGQGAFALLHISRTLRRITVLTGLPPLGGVEDSVGNVISASSALAMADAIYAISQVGALFLWGLGIVWLSFAVMSIADVLSVSDITLNLGLWASTFPVGTMAASAALFGAELNSTAFKVISTVLSVIVVLDVTWIASITLIKGWTGELFHAPDLTEIGGEVPTELPPSRKYEFEPRRRPSGITFVVNNLKHGNSGSSSASASRASSVNREAQLTTATAAPDRLRTRGRSADPHAGFRKEAAVTAPALQSASKSPDSAFRRSRSASSGVQVI
ncbi:hypothetical protein V8E36_005356 [Tilletia maclaganii]